LTAYVATILPEVTVNWTSMNAKILLHAEITAHAAMHLGDTHVPAIPVSQATIATVTSMNALTLADVLMEYVRILSVAIRVIACLDGRGTLVTSILTNVMNRVHVQTTLLA
jgi:hypothetical protein